MAGKGAVLAIRIVSDAKDAAAGFDQAEARVAGFQRGLDRATVAAGVFLGGMALLGKSAEEAASRLQQSSGAIEAVFGAQATQIEAAAKGAARGVGLSSAAYEEQAAVLGALLKNMGVSQGQLAPQVQKIIGWGADLAAVYGGPAADAVAALSSALRGETDPIERYGISIKQSTVNAALAAAGLDKLTGAAATQARTQVLLNLIQQQAGPALGQWSAQLGTAAEQSQTATASWENAKAALGEGLLPVMADASDKVSGFSQFLVDNKAVMVPLIETVTGLALAIVAVNYAIKAYAVVQGIANAVLTASPLGFALVIMGLVVGALVLLEQKTGLVSAAFSKVGDALFWAFDHAKEAISWVLDKVSWLINNLTVFGWISKLTGNGDLVNFGAAGTPGPAVAAYGAAAALAPAPLLFGAGTAAGAGGGSTAGPGLTLPPAGDTINITVNGALDPVAVADQIAGLLERRDRNTGRATVLRVGR